jgi:hypothetical protein
VSATLAEFAGPLLLDVLSSLVLDPCAGWLAPAACSGDASAGARDHEEKVLQAKLAKPAKQSANTPPQRA